MIESTPSRPYSNYVSDLLRVERNMILRRRRLISVLAVDEIAPYVSVCCLALSRNDILLCTDDVFPAAGRRRLHPQRAALHCALLAVDIHPRLRY